MSWSEFLLGGFLYVISFFLVIVFVFYITNICWHIFVKTDKLAKNTFSFGWQIITWPFRALWRLISPQKKKKTQHFHYEDDDIEIRF